MATTIVTKDPKIVSAGGARFRAFTVTAGASDTSMTIPTGFANVVFASFVSTVDDAHDTYLNYSDAGSTAALGTVYLDNIANSGTGTLLVLGY